MTSNVTEMPTLVQVRDTSKRFVINKTDSLKERLTYWRNNKRTREDFWALKNVSIDLTAGKTIGLIGHNGSGKSTLLKIIGGIISPTSGSVKIRGRLAALLELGAGFHPDLSGRENVFLNAAILGMSKIETQEKFEDIVEFSGIREFIDTPVKFYSSGMYVRLAFAVAVHTDPDILLVDEVLAVGDEVFQKKCMNKIYEFQKQQKTIILVTHALDLVEEFCHEAILLDHGNMIYKGDPKTAVIKLRDILNIGNSPSEETDHSLHKIESTTNIYNSKNQITNLVNSGETVTFEFCFKPDKVYQLENLEYSFIIKNSLGVNVYSVSSKNDQITIKTIEENKKVRITLDNLSLVPDKYYPQFIVENTEGRKLVKQIGTISFRVVSDEKLSDGVIHQAPKIVEL